MGPTKHFFDDVNKRIKAQADKRIKAQVYVAGPLITLYSGAANPGI